MGKATVTERGMALRLLYLFTAFLSWVIHGFGLLFSKKPVVLCYHGVVADQEGRFRAQMERLAKWKRIGTDPESPGSVYVTFDDAFENIVEGALPLLEELHIPSTIFAVSGNLGRTPGWDIAADHPDCVEKTMTAERLKSVCRGLVTVGSHTRTHPDLAKAAPERVREELAGSRKDLESLTGRKVEDLALPHGAYNDEVLRIAADSGYRRVFTLEPTPGWSDRGKRAAGRFLMSPDVWPIEFYLTCKGAYSWLYPLRRFLNAFRR